MRHAFESESPLARGALGSRLHTGGVGYRPTRIALKTPVAKACSRIGEAEVSGAMRPAVVFLRGGNEKQEKVPALIPRRGSHISPQCGLFRKRRLALFLGSETAKSAFLSQNGGIRRFCRIPIGANTDERQIRSQYSSESPFRSPLCGNREIWLDTRKRVRLSRRYCLKDGRKQA